MPKHMMSTVRGPGRHVPTCRGAACAAALDGHWLTCTSAPCVLLANMLFISNNAFVSFCFSATPSPFMGSAWLAIWASTGGVGAPLAH